MVGDSRNSAFAFIEFEDASPDSIFVKKKATPDWSPRFEHGFSQFVDWFFKLDEQKQAVDFEDKFGSRTILHLGLLVVGGTAHLGKREEQRLRWRQEYVLLNSKQIHCKTFDQLRDDLLDRLERFPVAAQREAAHEAKAEDRAAVERTSDEGAGLTPAPAGRRAPARPRRPRPAPSASARTAGRRATG